MFSPSPRSGKMSFAKTFIVPALLIFVIPLLSLLFFLHAESHVSTEAVNSAMKAVNADNFMSPAERGAAIDFLSQISFAELMKDDRFASQFDSTFQFYFLTFRWMIRLSWLSIVVGFTIFVLAGLCVLFSLRSPVAQYWSLSIGWHVLRIYTALQTIVLAILLVGLSYWVTALWFHFYSIKLIGAASILCVGAAGLVIKGIFATPHSQFSVEGTVLTPESAPGLWNELKSICDKVGAQPPDQVIAGIDDRFFVTENAVHVDGKEYRGKTLFVSLSLLKQLNESEARSVVAHEMAHFAGQDTLYSRKIAPMLQRYDNYLRALHEGGITIPIYYFMLCFRALYELSLGSISRKREFRADRVAADTTSPTDLSASLLRVVAYSHFRANVEQEPFKQERAMESANVADRIAAGFPAYAASFVQNSAIGTMTSSHPFDSHPPLSQRLSALGVQLDADSTRNLLTQSGDGRWLLNIPNAEELERSQWQAFEQQFRDYHETTLPSRYLPENDEERAVVEKAFPKIEIEGKSATLTMDCDQIQLSTWDWPLRFAEMTALTVDDSGTLTILYERDGERRVLIELRKFKLGENQVLEMFQHYYGRAKSAIEYRKHLAENQESASTSTTSRSIAPPEESETT